MNFSSSDGSTGSSLAVFAMAAALRFEAIVADSSLFALEWNDGLEAARELSYKRTGKAAQSLQHSKAQAGARIRRDAVEEVHSSRASLLCIDKIFLKKL